MVGWLIDGLELADVMRDLVFHLQRAPSPNQYITLPLPLRPTLRIHNLSPIFDTTHQRGPTDWLRRVSRILGTVYAQHGSPNVIGRLPGTPEIHHSAAQHGGEAHSRRPWEFKF